MSFRSGLQRVRILLFSKLFFYYIFKTPLFFCKLYLIFRAQTRLPISIKIREGNVEKREGVFATTVRGNIGSRNLEKAARMQKLISTDLNMVEVRRFEADLNEYCTIPSGELPFIEIKPGVKYELVFENMDIFKPHMKSRSPLSDMSPGPAKMDEIPVRFF